MLIPSWIGSPRARSMEGEGSLDHRIGHFRPRITMAQVLERLVLSIVRSFCIAQKQKGVANAMIEAERALVVSVSYTSYTG